MDLVLRAAAAFVVVFLFTRVVGRRELAQMQPIDVILLVLVGDLVQQGVTQNDMSITGIMLVIGTVGLLQVFVSYVSFRFRRLRPYINGVPVVMIENGKPIDRNMRRERVSIDDLTEEARLSEISSLDEIQWAVLETSGRMSFIKRQQSQS